MSNPTESKRSILQRLRSAAQGVSLGAEGMGWAPPGDLYEEAADEIQRLQEILRKISFDADMAFAPTEEQWNEDHLPPGSCAKDSTGCDV